MLILVATAVLILLGAFALIPLALALMAGAAVRLFLKPRR
jgi:hypothetical protein